MKKIYFAIALLIFSVTVFSQGMPSGVIYGKVVDSATGKPVEAATLQVFQTKMDTITKKPVATVINGALAAANGEFRIDNLPAMGRYKLVISGLGHGTKNIDFSFIDPAKVKQGGDMSALMGALDKDLGNIKLSIDNQMLEGVTVTGSRPAVQLGIDRKIYNVEGNLTAAGGTATDILKNIPAVSVDIDGNISIRNASPQIFVDGRPTTLTLDQIPGDQIETVEVITNPSAKYDASGGTAGILNIVLKKAKRVGYSGNLRAGIDQRGKFNAGANVNIRQGKFNFFANANYNQRKSINTGTTQRTTTLQNISTKLLQNDKSINNGTFMFGRLGFDYFLDNRNTLTVSGMGVRGKFNNTANSNIFIDSITSANNIQSKILRSTTGDFSFRNLGGGLAYVHNFPKNGHQLTADLNYNKSKNDNLSLISNANFAASNGPQTGSYKQQQNGNGNNERITAQIDYANPISDKAKLETGVRLNQSSVFSNNIFSIVSPNGSLIVQPPLSSNFNYTDRVWAGYGNFSSKIGDKFGYQLGLRLESSDYQGTVHSSVKNNAGGYRDTSSNFNISYPVSLFPSVFLSQQLPKDQQLQLNYSRRINRPGFFQLFPFTDYSDSLNLSRGNPNLKPEFTNSFELSYSKNFNRTNNLILSAYYKFTNGLITRFQSTELNPLINDTVIVNTFINANSSYVGGFEAIAKNRLLPWWDVTSSLNIYTSKINIDDPSIVTAGQMFSWFAKLNNDIKLPKNFTLQISADYNSKRVLAPGGSSGGGGGGGRGFMGGSVSGNAQGYSMPNFDVDAALKYEFLKNKAASVTLSASDIFRTNINEVYTNSAFFNQHSIRRRDQQFFRLNFTYRFGKFDASLFKRKNMRGEQEGMQGGMEGMGGQ